MRMATTGIPMPPVVMPKSIEQETLEVLKQIAESNQKIAEHLAAIRKGKHK